MQYIVQYIQGYGQLSTAAVALLPIASYIFTSIPRRHTAAGIGHWHRTERISSKKYRIVPLRAKQASLPYSIHDYYPERTYHHSYTRTHSLPHNSLSPIGQGLFRSLKSQENGRVSPPTLLHPPSLPHHRLVIPSPAQHSPSFTHN